MKNQRKSRRPVRPLPDDVVMEILSRLPADDVLKFRRVCRRWKALISTQYFAEMHLKANSSPMILVQERRASKVTELLLVDKWEPPRKRVRTRKLCLDSITISEDKHSYSLSLSLSYDGLIVMKRVLYSPDLTDFIIFNPITGDKVRIVSRIPGRKGQIYGMFFHPQIQEYCAVWGLFEKGPQVRFKMLSLGCQPCCRDLKVPSSWVYQPRRDPVVIGEATVYWMVADSSYMGRRPSCEEMIMAFDIKKEEFTVMPHPGLTDDGHCCNGIHSTMNILKMDGRLSFVQSTNTETSAIIKIWTLEDSATGVWIKSKIINIDNIDECLSYGVMRAMAVGNGELLMLYFNVKFYACNLELGTLRKLGRTFRTDRYASNISAAHVPSFVSLKDCKSEILMEENLEHE